MNAKPTFRELFEAEQSTLPYAVEGAILEFTEQVIARMESLELPRSELASRIGSSAAYITKVLGGATNFTLESMVKISNALGSELEIKLIPKATVEDWLPVIDKKFPAPVLDLQAWSRRMDCYGNRANENSMFLGPVAPPQLIYQDEATPNTTW